MATPKGGSGKKTMNTCTHTTTHSDMHSLKGMSAGQSRPVPSLCVHLLFLKPFLFFSFSPSWYPEWICWYFRNLKIAALCNSCLKLVIRHLYIVVAQLLLFNLFKSVIFPLYYRSKYSILKGLSLNLQLIQWTPLLMSQLHIGMTKSELIN